jgi:hypothetical protein
MAASQYAYRLLTGNVFMDIRVLLLMTLVLTACSHPIEIVGQGDVISASGDRDCLYEQHLEGKQNCSKNYVLTEYVETYYATPRLGWAFTGWGNYCKNSDVSEAQCSFNVPADWVELGYFETMPPLVAYFSLISNGYNGLYMGHSFFDPFIFGLNNLAIAAGFEEHNYHRFFEGGSGGAPIKFWEDIGADNAGIKSTLDEGGIELVGMTYYPFGDLDYELQGYLNWVEYALQNNPDAIFFIGMPWSQNPGSVTTQEYEANWESAHLNKIHYFIDVLRQTYPNNRFFCIPYGRGAIELRKLYDSGALPGVHSLVKTQDEAAIYSDVQGHADGILQELGSLLWLAAIYGVDLSQFDYTDLPTVNFHTAFPDVDLAEIARKVLDKHDHQYDLY